MRFSAFSHTSTSLLSRSSAGAMLSVAFFILGLLCSRDALCCHGAVLVPKELRDGIVLRDGNLVHSFPLTYSTSGESPLIVSQSPAMYSQFAPVSADLVRSTTDGGAQYGGTFSALLQEADLPESLFLDPPSQKTTPPADGRPGGGFSFLFEPAEGVTGAVVPRYHAPPESSWQRPTSSLEEYGASYGNAGVLGSLLSSSPLLSSVASRMPWLRRQIAGSGGPSTPQGLDDPADQRAAKLPENVLSAELPAELKLHVDSQSEELPTLVQVLTSTLLHRVPPRLRPFEGPNQPSVNLEDDESVAEQILPMIFQALPIPAPHEAVSEMNDTPVSPLPARLVKAVLGVLTGGLPGRIVDQVVHGAAIGTASMAADERTHRADTSLQSTPSTGSFTSGFVPNAVRKAVLSRVGHLPGELLSRVSRVATLPMFQRSPSLIQQAGNIISLIRPDSGQDFMITVDGQPHQLPARSAPPLDHLVPVSPGGNAAAFNSQAQQPLHSDTAGRPPVPSSTEFLQPEFVAFPASLAGPKHGMPHLQAREVDLDNSSSSVEMQETTQKGTSKERSGRTKQQERSPERHRKKKSTAKKTGAERSEPSHSQPYELPSTEVPSAKNETVAWLQGGRGGSSSPDDSSSKAVNRSGAGGKRKKKEPPTARRDDGAVTGVKSNSLSQFAPEQYSLDLPTVERDPVGSSEEPPRREDDLDAKGQDQRWSPPPMEGVPEEQAPEEGEGEAPEEEDSPEKEQEENLRKKEEGDLPEKEEEEDLRKKEEGDLPEEEEEDLREKEEGDLPEEEEEEGELPKEEEEEGDLPEEEGEEGDLPKEEDEEGDLPEEEEEEEGDLPEREDEDLPEDDEEDLPEEDEEDLPEEEEEEDLPEEEEEDGPPDDHDDPSDSPQDDADDDDDDYLLPNISQLIFKFFPLPAWLKLNPNDVPAFDWKRVFTDFFPAIDQTNRLKELADEVIYNEYCNREVLEAEPPADSPFDFSDDMFLEDDLDDLPDYDPELLFPPVDIRDDFDKCVGFYKNRTQDYIEEYKQQCDNIWSDSKAPGGERLRPLTIDDVTACFLRKYDVGRRWFNELFYQPWFHLVNNTSYLALAVETAMTEFKYDTWLFPAAYAAANFGFWRPCIEQSNCFEGEQCLAALPAIYGFVLNFCQKTTDSMLRDPITGERLEERFGDLTIDRTSRSKELFAKLVQGHKTG